MIEKIIHIVALILVVCGIIGVIFVIMLFINGLRDIIEVKRKNKEDNDREL